MEENIKDFHVLYQYLRQQFSVVHLGNVLMDFDPHHVNITVCSYLLFAAFLRFQLTVHAVCANFYLSFVLDDELCFSEF
ncbi:hypothetical protein C4D60_Mb06t16190 [Musa balbisiana]|uniref:Uncharacterized protein n=1 Tax=Musa balbisiana TaxID=52838 RepID=A0A4S8IP44_MUSBA|nr:hypothetical protein C4D60_Mb06t16190 [Musa balbisiana]